MVAIYTFSDGIDDERRRQIVYQGGLILFKDVAEITDLVPFIHELANTAFAPHDPLIAHEKFERGDYLEKVENFQRSVTNSTRVQTGFEAALRRLGIEIDFTGFSRFTMRVQPPSNSYIDRNTAALGPHRDSWYSQDYAQTNWWTPWYPLEHGRNLRIFPKFWGAPLPNSSEGWSLDAFREARARATASGGGFEDILNAYPPVRPIEDLREEDALELLFEPGDILNFSLAHLHQGPPNTTGFARFSTDFRTIHARDVADGIGAPNIDSKSTGSGLGDFKRLEDGRPIAQIASVLVSDNASAGAIKAN